jgi:anti-sigma factor RsiW
MTMGMEEEGIARLRAGASYHRAPAGLRESILATLPLGAGESLRSPRPGPGRGLRETLRWAWGALQGAGALAALALAIAYFGGVVHAPAGAPPGAPAGEAIAGGTVSALALGRELAQAHARAIVTGHAIDVASSDRHEVKPWLSARVDRAPPVRELRERGFPLLGGRIDYVQDRTVAVMVYGRRKHSIDVFVLPGGAELPAGLEAQGFHEESVAVGDLRLVAVSEVEPGELKDLLRLLVNGS